MNNIAINNNTCKYEMQLCDNSLCRSNLITSIFLHSYTQLFSTLQLIRNIFLCTGGTLSTSDVSRRKSSIPVTPTFFKKHFNGSESPAVKHCSNTENRSSSSQIPNRLFLEPDRNESKGRSRRVQNNYDTKNNNDSSKNSKRLYLEPKCAEFAPYRNNCMKQPENIMVEDLQRPKLQCQLDSITKDNNAQLMIDHS